jgi:hypothetical protein
MKPLSMLRVALATAAVFVCTSFTPGKESALYGKHSAVEFDVLYYWYDADDDYMGFEGTTDMIAYLEDSLQAIVNTNSIGGTFVAAGYTNNMYPHMVWPMINLYSH